MVKLTCSNAKDVITFLFFQFLIKEISNNKFSFGTQNDRVSVTFLPFHINDDFEVKIGASNELKIYTKQNIEIEKLNTESIKIQFLLGFHGKLDKFSLKVPDLIFLNSPVINENIIEIPYGVVFNCTEDKIFIPEGQLLFTASLGISSDHVVLSKCPADSLRQLQLSHFDNLAE